MGTFNSSHVLSSFVSDAFGVGHTYNLSTDTFKIALYTSTPDATVFPFDSSVVHNAFSGVGGQFVSGNEVFGGSWATGGYTLVSPALAVAASTNALVHWSVTNVSQVTSTLTAFQGGLVYDSTLAGKEGICAIYFGGSYSVGGGTLAINWGNDTNGSACVFYITG
jgi:hypothetical protein